MAQVVTDPGVVMSWVHAKQTNEQELARRIYQAFGAALPMRNMVMVLGVALSRMQLELASNPVPVRSAVTGDPDLPVWRHVRAKGADPADKLVGLYNALLAGGTDFSVDDLSNIVRIVGSWIEKGGGYGGEPNLNFAYREGVHDKVTHWHAEPGLVWGPDVRQREQRITDPTLYHAIEAHVRGAWVRPPIRRGQEDQPNDLIARFPVGMNMLRANRNDSCRKLALVFGLIKGATLSGTAADTTMVLEAFGQGIISPGYYLFPVGAVAGVLHHSMLEVSLALALDDIIDDYHVGYYTTLVPKDGLAGELSAIQALLVNAENDQRNRHFVCWYDPGSEVPSGLVRWDKPWEIRLHRAKLSAGKHLLQQARYMPPFPGPRDVGDMVFRMAPDLVPSLPGMMQPRQVHI